MSSGIKVYKIKDFIRKSESGEVDFDKSIQIVRELSTAAAFHADHNILIDLRKTTASIAGMEDLMKIAMELVQCMPPSFKNKIANVIPSDEERVSFAKMFEACLKIKKFQYRFFTEFEHAIEWLSELKS
jgi:hypothetical protein